ncbi:hypothetical protein JF768_03920 [Mycobacterium intracellulare]|uniref:hypothetical protein n=1 Tax=Mycobacterium intracellulare TaxID=1767 RepID=UPI001CD98F64|nr:hypothetical protein [Mycobacterium intracellulare]MCA2272425.1 hypothetical protein [Mycobacterium intracellulare]
MAQATFSEWHEKIAEHRVDAYDQLRPIAVRVASLAAIIAGFVVLRAGIWTWLALLPAAFQTPLEVYLQGYHSKSAGDPRWQVARAMRDHARNHFQTMTLNVTGIIGIAACPLNILAVSWAPAGGDAGWIKIAALAAAIFYLNSGLASVFLDPPNYTENSVMPPFMHTLRPYSPLISYLIITTIVWVSVDRHRWEHAMVPIAYLCAGLTLLLGANLRNHDRMIAAAAHVGCQAVEAGRKELGGVVHDDLGPAKAAAESVSRLDGVAYRDAVDLQALSAFLTHFSTRVGIFAAQRMELGYLAKKIVSPYGVSARNVACDIRWNEQTLRNEDHRIAVRMTTALIHNVGQALQKEENRAAPKKVTLEGHTSGSGRDMRYHVAVRDHLPPIPPADWCPDGGTLAALREWLRDTFNGDLTQEVCGDGTKRIIASWGDRPPNTWAEGSSEETR